MEMVMELCTPLTKLPRSIMGRRLIHLIGRSVAGLSADPPPPSVPRAEGVTCLFGAEDALDSVLYILPLDGYPLYR